MEFSVWDLQELLISLKYCHIIIIIIIALKGAVRDFYNLLTVPRTVSNTYVQVARVQLCANHVQNIERFSRATCRMPLCAKGQLSF